LERTSSYGISIEDLEWVIGPNGPALAYQAYDGTPNAPYRMALFEIAPGGGALVKDAETGATVGWISSDEFIRELLDHELDA